MNDAEYATSKHIKLHRYLSVGLVVSGTVFYSVISSPAYAVRQCAIFVFPLTLIWYSDQLACWAIGKSGYWLNSSNADIAVRIAGWMSLLTFFGLKFLPLIFN